MRDFFDDPAQVKALFPRYNDGGTACIRRKAVLAKLESLRGHPLREIKDAIAALCADNFGCLPPVGKSDGVTRRIDGLLKPIDGKGKRIGIDVSGVSDSTVANIGPQLSKHLALQSKSFRAFTSNFHLGANTDDFPAIMKAVKKKNDIYSLIDSLANLQATKFGSQLKFKFVAGIMTHRCEMSKDLINTIEYCTNRYKASLRVSPHVDGLSPSAAGSIYRAQFKTDLCVQMVRGFGRQLLATSSMSFSAAVS